MNYLILLLAILTEVIGTTFLKKSDGFRDLTMGFVALSSYGVSLFLLSIAMRTIPVSITYSIWCGLGIVLISLIGFFAFKQSLDAPALIGIALIMAGVIVIRFFSSSVA